MAYKIEYHQSDYGTERCLTVRADDGRVIGQRDPFAAGIPVDAGRRAKRIEQAAREIIKMKGTK